MFDLFLEISLTQLIFDNRISELLLAALILLVGFILKRLISKLIGRLVFQFFKKYSKDAQVSYNDFDNLILKPLEFFVIVVAFYFAFNLLHFPESWHLVSEKEFGVKMLILRAFQLTLIISIVRILLRIVDFLALIYNNRAKNKFSNTELQLIPFFKDAIKVLVVILTFFFILGYVFHLNIASIIAGLGIGGLAFALAAKETLENLLGSFTIFIDKPFTVGDYIKIGNVEGTVEKIGFRSTRIRTLEKTFLTIPNKKLVDTELDNLTLRLQRNISFTINLSYHTPKEKVEFLINHIKNYIDTHELSVKEGYSVVLNDFTEFGFQIKIQFLIQSIDLKTFLGVKQDLNLNIIQTMAEQHIEFGVKTN